MVSTATATLSTTTNSLQSHQQTSRLDFLFEAGHTMLSECPSLSRYYMNEFQNTLTEYELTAHKPIARLSCKSCGQISIPGLNHRIEIIHKQSRKQNKTKKRVQPNTIKSTCLTCGNTSLYHGSNKRKMPKLIMQQVPAMAAAKPIVTLPAAASVSAPTGESLKKKKNKGKKNNLKALLNKQQKPNNNGNNGSGGLGDFLSSL